LKRATRASIVARFSSSFPALGRLRPVRAGAGSWPSTRRDARRVDRADRYPRGASMSPRPAFLFASGVSFPASWPRWPRIPARSSGGGAPRSARVARGGRVEESCRERCSDCVPRGACTRRWVAAFGAWGEVVASVWNVMGSAVPGLGWVASCQPRSVLLARRLRAITAPRAEPGRAARADSSNEVKALSPRAAARGEKTASREALGDVWTDLRAVRARRRTHRPPTFACVRSGASCNARITRREATPNSGRWSPSTDGLEPDEAASCPGLSGCLQAGVCEQVAALVLR
jgi:hypothetical protein